MACGCCGFDATADLQFNAKRARLDLARYRAKGPDSTTRLLLNSLAELGETQGSSLLDVGSGVGALTFELLELGVTHATDVEAAAAFLAVAAEEALRRKRSGVTEFVQGDFLSVAAQLPAATMVTLDRVICCYPAFQPMLTEALQHAQRCLGISYPRERWYVRLGIAVENVMRRLTGNPFRAFVHPVSRMEEIIERAGFCLAKRRQTWMWCADVYLRKSGPASSGAAPALARSPTESE